MRIQHNIMAMSAYRNYTNNVSAMKKNLEKLSSGYKINRAGDDAAGLAISEKMRAQITGLETAQKNAKDGISLVQTAEGTLTEVHDMLNRMVELATMSANGTYDDTTDRAQLQKEVDQLTDEINRIADSANFNGIKLLDGSLGMNKDGFQVGDVIAATAAGKAANASDKLTFATSGDDAYHGKAAAPEQKPTFTIDLADLKITNMGSASVAASKFTIKIGGTTITLGSSFKVAGSSSVNGSTIAAAIASAVNKMCGSAASASNTFGWNVGSSGMVVHATAAGGKITFTYAGVLNAAGTNVEATSVKFTEEQAKEFNKIFTDGGKFEISVATATGVTTTGMQYHDFLNVKEAVSGASVRAGIDLTIDADLIKDGSTLTIGNKTFEFKVSADHTVASGNETIDLSKLGADASAAALLREAVQQLSHKNVTATVGSKSFAFDIEAVGSKAGTIHIEQTVANYASGANSIDVDDIKDFVSAQMAGAPAAAAKVDLTVDTSKLVKGNVLTIDEDNKFTYGEDFNTVEELKGLIEAKGYGVEMTGNKLTISAKSVTDEAPVILGKGLTLQIGDTAESFNQLNVSVKDCHAKSLGIDTNQISIADADSAQEAIDKIKNAINYVSDVRGTLGATQNRLDHTINNLSVMTENIQDAESTIRDVDVAEEMMAYTKNNILIQSAQAMLAQANQVPQGVLQLLQ